MNGIAVVLPVYNGEKLIERCVRKIPAAGERIEEIIIVDDGSTDGTLGIAQRLAGEDDRISVVHTSNHGIYEARRKGIAASTAPYIAFLDVDDRYIVGALDTLADLLESHKADVTMGGIVEVNSLDVPDPEPGKTIIREQTPEQMWPRIMKWGTQEFILYVWHKLYRRELLENLIPADGICQGEDVLITCQAFLKAKKTVETTRPVYMYCQNPDSLTHKGFGKHDLDLICVWDRVVGLMDSQSEELQHMARFNRWRTDFTLICRLILADDRELDRKYADELRMWRSGLKAHWKELVSPHVMPRNREILIVALRFAFGPTKLLMRKGKKLLKR